MALPILAVVQAVTTLLPMFKKKSQTEIAEAKLLLIANNSSTSSKAGYAGLIAVAGWLLANPPTSAWEWIVMSGIALASVGAYFVKAK